MDTKQEEVEKLIASFDDKTKLLLSLLADTCKSIRKRQDDFYGESRILGFEIRNFNHQVDVLRKELKTKHFDSIMSRYMIWKFESENDAYKKLEELEVAWKGESIPFLSEGFLYEAIGKEDARTVLALMRKVYEAAGKTSNF